MASQATRESSKRAGGKNACARTHRSNARDVIDGSPEVESMSVKFQREVVEAPVSEIVPEVLHGQF